MGGMSGVINQAAQAVKQPEAPQPQYNQPQPSGMMGGGIISQAYNQVANQQPQQTFVAPQNPQPSGFLGSMVSNLNNQLMTQNNQPSAPQGLYGQGMFGQVSDFVNNQQPAQLMQPNVSSAPLNNPVMSDSNPFMQGNVNQNPMLPNQMAYGDGLNAPSLQSEVPTNYTNTLPASQPNTSFNNSGAGLPRNRISQNIPISGMPQQMPTQPSQGLQRGQSRFDYMQNRMQRFQDAGRRIPQGFQSRYDDFMSKQPQMSRQQRLAKMLKGE